MRVTERLFTRICVAMILFAVLSTAMITTTHGQLLSLARFYMISMLNRHQASWTSETLSPEYDHSITLLAAGDIAQCKVPRIGSTLANLGYSLGMDKPLPPRTDAANQTANLASLYPSATVLALGDLAYPDGSPADFERCYDSAWGSLKSRTLPTPGNHEYGSPGGYGYLSYWGSTAGLERNNYYAKSLDNWLLLSLNSEIPGSTDSTQGVWLEQQLEKTEANCILAFFHRPAYSSNSRGDDQNAVDLFSILYRHGISLVLNGHNHLYERTATIDAEGNVDTASGIRTIIVGTGGAKLDDVHSSASYSVRLITHENGLLKLHLARNSYRWDFISSSTRKVLDSGQANCKATH